MWFLIVALFLFATDSNGALNCDNNIDEECPITELLFRIPPTIAEYNSLCPELETYLKCLKEWEDKCERDTGLTFFDNDKMYESLLDVSSDLCDEDALLYAVVTENLKCLNETLETSSCYDEAQAAIREFKTSFTVDHDEEYSHPSRSYYCLRDLVEVECYTNDVHVNCGTLAAEAMKEFVRRSYYIEFNCKAENLKLILSELDKYRLKSHHNEPLAGALEELIRKFEEQVQLK
ncbi:hypothetical protein CDAR_68221 [Caerostris darwini]|uniref:Uncharacterized protein n=1 Tax=Caerostris darwini TaxID=1538125 RepID=A0AAV4N0F9_9ARAC|nr:hypothetical protein CDAR_68221 [Caerostris darwini]